MSSVHDRLDKLNNIINNTDEKTVKNQGVEQCLQHEELIQDAIQLKRLVNVKATPCPFKGAMVMPLM